MAREINELAKALAAAQGEFPTVAKDASNPFFKSKYADLATVVKTASPVLSKHGLAVSQFVVTKDAVDYLDTWLMHGSGQYLHERMRLMLKDQTPQGQGSAISYARRYSYMAVLGLVADEDDDGNAASSRTAQAGSTRATRPTQPPPLPSQAVLENSIIDPNDANGDNRPYDKKAWEQAKAAMTMAGISTKEQAIAFYQKVLGKKVPATMGDVEKLIAAAADYASEEPF